MTIMFEGVFKMKLVMMLLVMVLSSSALSNQTGSGKINYLQNGYNGWLFSIDDSNSNPDNCPKPTMKLN